MRKTLFAAALLSAGAALAYEVSPVKDGGSINGGVRFEGKAPEPQKVTVDKDPEVCGAGARVVNEVTADAKGNLKDAVVYLEKIPSGKAWSLGDADFLIEQQGCRFMPKSRVMKKGATVKIKNKDKVFHNIHAYDLAGKQRISMFNDGQPADSELAHDLRMRKGDEMKLECDAHKFMHEWVLVLDHPYFATTSAEGKFSLAEVPPGSYQLVAWHPVLGRTTAKVEVKAGTPASVDFTFKP